MRKRNRTGSGRDDHQSRPQDLLGGLGEVLGLLGRRGEEVLGLLGRRGEVRCQHLMYWPSRAVGPLRDGWVRCGLPVDELPVLLLTSSPPPPRLAHVLFVAVFIRQLLSKGVGGRPRRRMISLRVAGPSGALGWKIQ
eukprot:3800426-Pyramimonas_sp.AAC.1